LHPKISSKFFIVGPALDQGIDSMDKHSVLGLGLFHFPSILYKVVDHKDIEIVKYIKSIQDPKVNC